jgi:hypothetical protein
MTPFKVAFWIAKFVFSLALLLAIPVALFYGGVFTVAGYHRRQVCAFFAFAYT